MKGILVILPFQIALFVMTQTIEFTVIFIIIFMCVNFVIYISFEMTLSILITISE